MGAHIRLDAAAHTAARTEIQRRLSGITHTLVEKIFGDPSARSDFDFGSCDREMTDAVTRALTEVLERNINRYCDRKLELFEWQRRGQDGLRAHGSMPQIRAPRSR